VNSRTGEFLAVLLGELGGGVGFVELQSQFSDFGVHSSLLVMCFLHFIQQFRQLLFTVVDHFLQLPGLLLRLSRRRSTL